MRPSQELGMFSPEYKDLNGDSLSNKPTAGLFKPSFCSTSSNASLLCLGFCFDQRRGIVGCEPAHCEFQGLS